VLTLHGHLTGNATGQRPELKQKEKVQTQIYNYTILLTYIFFHTLPDKHFSLFQASQPHGEAAK
jgi:hypothetical protein